MSWALDLAWHIEQGHISPSELARLHELTAEPVGDTERHIEKVRTITDRTDVLAFVLNLSARYEERAPATPEPPLPEFPKDRCRICGWLYAPTVKEGCVPGNCSMRPAPKTRADAGYAPARIATDPEESGTTSSTSTTQACSTPNKFEIAESERLSWTRMNLDERLSELNSWIKQNGPETARARINALTRKTTMSDEDIQTTALKIYDEWADDADVDTAALRHALLDLRDRYEERGKYAISPATPAPAPESQPATSTPGQATQSDQTTDS